MSFSDGLKSEVATIFREQWSKRDGYVVPIPSGLRLGNDGVELDATILYADMAESTELVNTQKPHFAAEVYKAYLTCCAKIIKNNDGEITSYDGDRVMGVFLGDNKNTSAAKTALQINHAVRKIVAPAILLQYPAIPYILEHAVGVDTSKVLVARIGVRNDNDLVWVGRAANYAAKLCSLRDGNYSSWISEDVYNRLAKSSKISSDGKDMWERRIWTARNNFPVYRSSWTWGV